MTALYNEIDPDAAHVLRTLIDDGVIAPGVVDTRSIKDLTPDDLAGFTQCHFFAGGGLWSVAARLAGWPDDRPLWTGSCPCQPFSAAGKGGGVDDPRHLWPDFFRLIRACRPPVVMGEQVAGAPGYGWFDGVRADLAGEDYASRCVDIPACAVDAPHIRQRLYWAAVGDAEGGGWASAGRSEAHHRAPWCGEHRGSDASGLMVNAPRLGRGEGRPEHELRGWRPALARADAQCDMADRSGVGREVSPAGQQPAEPWPVSDPHSHGGLDVANADRGGRGEWARLGAHGARVFQSPNGSFWSGAEWLACHDGKARRTKPGLRLLVDGMPGRVGLWRIAGNAIVAPLAAEVIAAFLDAETDDQRFRLMGAFA